MFAYQAEKSGDLDPETDNNGAYGDAKSPLRIAMIYLENIVDVCTKRVQDPPTLDMDRFNIMVSNVVAHEVAHVPGSGDGQEDHAEGGLMGTMNLESIAPEKFEPLTIDRLRDASSWSPQ